MMPGPQGAPSPERAPGGFAVSGPDLAYIVPRSPTSIPVHWKFEVIEKSPRDVPCFPVTPHEPSRHEPCQSLSSIMEKTGHRDVTSGCRAFSTLDGRLPSPAPVEFGPHREVLSEALQIPVGQAVPLESTYITRGVKVSPHLFSTPGSRALRCTGGRAPSSKATPADVQPGSTPGRGTRVSPPRQRRGPPSSTELARKVVVTDPASNGARSQASPGTPARAFARGRSTSTAVGSVHPLAVDESVGGLERSPTPPTSFRTTVPVYSGGPPTRGSCAFAPQNPCQSRLVISHEDRRDWHHFFPCHDCPREPVARLVSGVCSYRVPTWYSVYFCPTE